MKNATEIRETEKEKFKHSRYTCEILDCTCKNAFQDKLYGLGRRVFNPCVIKQKLIKVRCTSCGRER